MPDQSNLEKGPTVSDVSPAELEAARANMQAATFRSEVSGAGDSASAAHVGGTALSPELISGVPAATEVTPEDHGPTFVEPEGGYDTGATTQPDYAQFSRDSTQVAFNTNGLGSTGELGDTSPRDDNGRGAKNPPVQYGQAPETVEGARVIEP